MRSILSSLRLNRLELVMMSSAVGFVALTLAVASLYGDVPNSYDVVVSLYFVILLFLIERRVREADQREIVRLREMENRQTELVTQFRDELRKGLRAVQAGVEPSELLPRESQLIQEIKAQLERFSQEWESYERDHTRRIGRKVETEIGVIANGLLRLVSLGVGILPAEIAKETKEVAYEMRSKIGDRLGYLGDFEAFNKDGREVASRVRSLQEKINRYST